MAWARFRNSIRYYRKVRVGKRVHSIYLGNGVAAEAAAQAVEKAATERRALQVAKLKDKALDARINALTRQSAAVTAEVLTASGFHQYQRQWKLKTPPTKN